jgi:hypothetical protein
MKATSKKLQEIKNTKSEVNALIPKEKKTFYERLMEKGYSESKIGQGFVMNWKMPKQE